MVRLSELRKALKGLPVDPDRIFDELSGHAYLVVNPKTITVGWGSQRWGSGGYNWYTEVYFGDLREHERIDAERYNDQFIEYVKETYKINPKKPLVVYTHEYDCISSDGHRCFGCTLYVVNPNLSEDKQVDVNDE